MKKNNLIIFYSMVGLFILSLGFFIVSFAYSSIENISVMGFKSRLEEYNKQEEKFLKLEATYKEWQNMDKMFAQFKEKYLIKFNDYPKFRNELQTVISGNGLQNSDMNHKYRNIMRNLRKVSLELKLTGSYVNLKKFIFEIENKDKMVLLKDLQFFKKDAVNVSAKISMEVYFVR
jgi:Tfp pilus assembly protein PilO